MKIFRNFIPNSRFFLKCRPISRFFANFDQNRVFLAKEIKIFEISTKIKIFGLNFDLIWDLLTTMEIVQNVDQDRYFIKFQSKLRFSNFRSFFNFDQNEKFKMILHKIEFLEIFDLSRDYSQIFTKIDIFRKFQPKSRLFANFDQSRVFRKFRPNSRFSKISTKVEIFENFHQNWDFRIFFTKIEIFTKISIQIEIFQNFQRNRDI